MSDNQNQRTSHPGALGLVAKFASKGAPVAVKLFKAVKVGKLALVGASFAGYALLLSWQFAVVIIGVILVHEYAHVLVMKRFQMKVKGMYFIPFIGAAAVSESEFPSRKAEALSAYVGPATGLAFGLGGMGLYALTHNGYVAAITGFAALINLFNLLPINPLDGGRVIKSLAMSISTKVGLGFMIGSLALAAVVAYKFDLVIVAILIPLGVFEFIVERRRHRKAYDRHLREKAYAADRQPWYRVSDAPVMLAKLSRRATVAIFAAYLGLATALFGIMLLMKHEPGAAAALHILQG